MNTTELINYRLYNQQLLSSTLQFPKDIVHYFGAMQAQDYNMAKWAIGARLENYTDNLIEKAINDGEIIRTHILRPTWHFVSAENIRWMLELTAPHVKPVLNSYIKKIGLDNSILFKSLDVIQKSLSGNIHLTREELALALENSALNSVPLNIYLLMMYAELEGIVCNGSMKNKQISYALFDERVPKSPQLSQEEALAKLAFIYFKSHSPATLQDFSWWSGLSLTKCKLAIELNKNLLQFFENKGVTYYYFKNSLIETKENNIHFLPAFDEFLISYKDRTASISLEKQSKAFTNNGIFWPIIIVNGKVIGTWKRTIKKDNVLIETTFFETTNIDKDKILEAAKCYADFMEKTLIL